MPNIGAQALPLLALALWRLGSARWRFWLGAGAAVGVAVTLAALVQALLGRPFL